MSARRFLGAIAAIYPWLVLFILSSPAQAALFEAPDEQKVLAELPLDANDTHFVQTKWNGRSLLFVDYLTESKSEPGDDQPEYDRHLVAVEKLSGGSFRTIDITTVTSEGGSADVVAIGFANADDDNAQELIVLVGWEQRHAFVSGTLYEVRIYDDLASSGGSSPRYLKEISQHFDAHACDCDRADGPSDHYPFKTIVAIKRELKSLAINRRAKRPSLH